MEIISDHISYKEAVHSATAKIRGIRNVPNTKAVTNMKAIAENVFEPLRSWVGGAIKINSFYMSKALNTAIGGSSTSQHCKGEAIDLDDTYGHKTNAEMFWYIVNNLEHDQIIAEFPKKGNPSWVHVSYKKNGGNRNRILLAHKVGGRTRYTTLSKLQAKKYVY
jgi:hypothetical protein